MKINAIKGKRKFQNKNVELQTPPADYITFYLKETHTSATRQYQF